MNPPARAHGAWSRRQRGEIGAVFATALLHLLFQEVIGLHAVFVLGAVLAWTYYLMRRAREEPTLLSSWGFRRQNLLPSFIAMSGVAAIGLVGMALIGMSRGHLRLHWHMLVALALYPIWGLIQQFLVQALVAANLRRGGGWLARPAVVVAISAGAFALVHAPGREIMLATFLMGCAFTPTYLRWRNLWPLGLYHGWLGLFFYFWVRGTNPVAGLFSR